MGIRVQEDIFAAAMNHRIFILLALFAMVLSSCEEECDPPDVDALNGIYLEFDTDGGMDSFTAAELDSVYMVRFIEADFDSFLFPVDTFRFYQEGFYLDQPYRIRLSRQFPLGLPSGPPYYSSFKYLFKSFGQDFQVRLQSIELDGSYTDDCNYETRLKRYVLNDDTLEVTGSTQFVKMVKD
jgi:hypothetical protein